MSTTAGLAVFPVWHADIQSCRWAALYYLESHNIVTIKSSSGFGCAVAVVDRMLMCMGGSMSLYMVIENFRNGEAVPVYRRF